MEEEIGPDKTKGYIVMYGSNGLELYKYYHRTGGYMPDLDHYSLRQLKRIIEKEKPAFVETETLDAKLRAELK